jgi:hypothetical protein
MFVVNPLRNSQDMMDINPLWRFGLKPGSVFLDDFYVNWKKMHCETIPVLIPIGADRCRTKISRKSELPGLWRDEPRLYAKYAKKALCKIGANAEEKESSVNL